MRSLDDAGGTSLSHCDAIASGDTDGKRTHDVDALLHTYGELAARFLTNNEDYALVLKNAKWISNELKTVQAQLEPSVAMMTAEQRQNYFNLSQGMQLAPLMAEFNRRILRRDQLKMQLAESFIETMLSRLMLSQRPEHHFGFDEPVIDRVESPALSLVVDTDGEGELCDPTLLDNDVSAPLPAELSEPLLSLQSLSVEESDAPKGEKLKPSKNGTVADFFAEVQEQERRRESSKQQARARSPSTDSSEHHYRHRRSRSRSRSESSFSSTDTFSRWTGSVRERSRWYRRSNYRRYDRPRVIDHRLRCISPVRDSSVTSTSVEPSNQKSDRCLEMLHRSDVTAEPAVVPPEPEPDFEPPQRTNRLHSPMDEDSSDDALSIVSFSSTPVVQVQEPRPCPLLTTKKKIEIHLSGRFLPKLGPKAAVPTESVVPPPPPERPTTPSEDVKPSPKQMPLTPVSDRPLSKKGPKTPPEENSNDTPKVALPKDEAASASVDTSKGIPAIGRPICTVSPTPPPAPIPPPQLPPYHMYQGPHPMYPQPAYGWSGNGEFYASAHPMCYPGPEQMYANYAPPMPFDQFYPPPGAFMPPPPSATGRRHLLSSSGITGPTHPLTVPPPPPGPAYRGRGRGRRRSFV